MRLEQSTPVARVIALCSCPRRKIPQGAVARSIMACYVSSPFDGLEHSAHVIVIAVIVVGGGGVVGVGELVVFVFYFQQIAQRNNTTV